MAETMAKACKMLRQSPTCTHPDPSPISSSSPHLPGPRLVRGVLAGVRPLQLGGRALGRLEQRQHFGKAPARCGEHRVPVPQLQLAGEDPLEHELLGVGLGGALGLGGARRRLLARRLGGPVLQRRREVQLGGQQLDGLRCLDLARQVLLQVLWVRGCYCRGGGEGWCDGRDKQLSTLEEGQKALAVRDKP